MPLPLQNPVTASPIPPYEAVNLAEFISMMSFALDMSDGAEPGHALRSCVLGMRLAHALSLEVSLHESLYYALLLKDAGCTGNAARMTQIAGGNELALKAAVKLTDWTRPHRVDLRTLKIVWRNVCPESSSAHRVARLAHMAITQHKTNREMIALRCECGARTVRSLGLGERAAEAVQRLAEHWDGSGYPGRLQGSRIPLLSRLCAVAQTLDVFAQVDGQEAALAVLRKRSGTWFDPAIVAAAEALHVAGKLWRGCEPGANPDGTRQRVLDLDPARATGQRPPLLNPERIDQLCELFAAVIDQKSPYPYPHSIAVAETAVAIASELGLTAERVRLVRRASLLHDLGKLHVANAILDKPGSLNARDWHTIAEHPGHTRSVLERVPAFRELAAVAGQHHERLNGSGYPLGLSEKELSLEARIVALADCFTSMAEDRPYRKGMELRKIFDILEGEAPHRLDNTCFQALRTAVERGNKKLATSDSKAPWRTPRKPPQNTWSGPASLRRAV